MRLPISPSVLGFHDPTRDPLEPHVIERAVDAPARQRCVVLTEVAFQDANPDDETLRRLPTVLMHPELYGRRALLDVRQYSEARGIRVLMDGSIHRDFPDYVSVAGCLHAPPGVCRRVLPRPRPNPQHLVEPHDETNRCEDVPDAELYTLG